MRGGVFIGASNYRDNRIKNLQFAHNDANLIIEQLKATCEFNQDAIVKLISGEKSYKKRPTKENILTELSAVNKRTPLETFVFFFSGHGFRSEKGLDYLIPQNATLDALDDTSILMSDIIRRCCDIDARQILILLDACRNLTLNEASIKPLHSSIDGSAFSDKRLTVIFLRKQESSLTKRMSPKTVCSLEHFVNLLSMNMIALRCTTFTKHLRILHQNYLTGTISQNNTRLVIS